MNKLILSILFMGISLHAMSQAVALDPTGKRFMKPKERTKYGGPVHAPLKIEKGPDNINITFVEMQLDPAAKGGGIDVSVRGTKTPKIRGCDNCTVAGRVILSADAAKEIPSVSNDEASKTKQAKNPASGRRVSFKSESNQEYAVVTNPEGGFMLSTLPNGTYSIWVGDKKVVTDFILTTVEPSPEDLQKEQELKKQQELKRQQATETPATDH